MYETYELRSVINSSNVHVTLFHGRQEQEVPYPASRLLFGESSAHARLMTKHISCCHIVSLGAKDADGNPALLLSHYLPSMGRQTQQNLRWAAQRLQEREFYAEAMSVYGPHRVSAHHERFIEAATHLGEFAQATLGIAIDTEFYTKPDPEVLPFGHMYYIDHDEASQSFLQASNNGD